MTNTTQTMSPAEIAEQLACFRLDRECAKRARAYWEGELAVAIGANDDAGIRWCRRALSDLDAEAVERDRMERNARAGVRTYWR